MPRKVVPAFTGLSVSRRFIACTPVAGSAAAPSREHLVVIAMLIQKTNAGGADYFLWRFLENYHVCFSSLLFDYVDPLRGCRVGIPPLWVTNHPLLYVRVRWPRKQLGAPGRHAGTKETPFTARTDLQAINTYKYSSKLASCVTSAALWRWAQGIKNFYGQWACVFDGLAKPEI